MRLPDSCPICASSFMSYVRTLPTRKRSPVDLFYCMECESFSSPFAATWPPVSAVDWHQSVMARNLEWGRQLLDQIEPRGPVIDIGCGIGTLLIAARERGLDGVGYDLDGPACDYGRQTFDLDLRGEFWSRTTSPPAGLITCVSVLEHIHQPRELIRDLVGAAKDHNCALYISVPFCDRDRWPLIYSDTLTPGHFFEMPDVHVTHFSKKGLEKVCREFGASSVEPLSVPKAWYGFLIR